MGFKDFARCEGNNNANGMQSFQPRNMQIGQSSNHVSGENIEARIKELSTTPIGCPLRQLPVSRKHSGSL